ncbi:unnamed protein product [Ascophyllum nodosum]
MVMQLIQDFEDVSRSTRALIMVGYDIGVRLIDEFLAKCNVSTPGASADPREAADVIAKVAFKMFLGVTTDVASWNGDRTAFILLLYDKPRTDVYV